MVNEALQNDHNWEGENDVDEPFVVLINQTVWKWTKERMKLQMHVARFLIQCGYTCDSPFNCVQPYL